MTADNNFPALIPLRIPSWWSVLFNKFYDVVPEADGTESNIKNWHYFTSRLLNIHVVNQQSASIDYEHTLFIDVGWSSESDVNGFYEAGLIYTNKKKGIIWKEIQTFTSSDRFAIAEVVERWMEDVDVTDPFSNLD